ncbi:hypothetical protein [Aestuariivivens marinum]|uniref:hypothetical protein n=1 Tax=Aestuariivivens marinum TaxID=2913555 RepID=UPI001F5AEE1B|nr:hypothetical protein [Aestuariivivens marinum]
MKTSKQLLKVLCIGFMLVFSAGVFAQKPSNSKSVFLRVYNLEGKKISKGKLIFVNDSTLTLNRNGKKFDINFNTIGKIKTKHSGGHNVLVGALAGGTLGAIIGISTADPDAWIYSYSKSEGAYAGGLLGAAGGAAIGGVTAGFKESETYIINGDIVKWKIFKEQIMK